MAAEQQDRELDVTSDASPTQEQSLNVDIWAILATCVEIQCGQTASNAFRYRLHGNSTRYSASNLAFKKKTNKNNKKSQKIQLNESQK